MLNSILRNMRKTEKDIFAPFLNFRFHNSIYVLFMFLKTIFRNRCFLSKPKSYVWTIQERPSQKTGEKVLKANGVEEIKKKVPYSIAYFVAGIAEFLSFITNFFIYFIDFIV